MNEHMARAKRAKWKRYIESAEGQVIVLMDRRRWNRVYEAIVNANPALPAGNPMLRYFRRVYGDYAVMAIRRQAKPHDDAFSLSDLIRDIAANPTVLTPSRRRSRSTRNLSQVGSVTTLRWRRPCLANFPMRPA
jgi:hypothetical protein